MNPLDQHQSEFGEFIQTYLKRNKKTTVKKLLAQVDNFVDELLVLYSDTPEELRNLLKFILQSVKNSNNVSEFIVGQLNMTDIDFFNLDEEQNFVFFSGFFRSYFFVILHNLLEQFQYQHLIKLLF